MTNKTREDFERWATEYFGSAGYTYSEWSAYQQGLADARKPSTETAAEWIARHETEYGGIASEHSHDTRTIRFRSFTNGSYAALVNAKEDTQYINLETADDCIKLCELLRVTPVERKTQ